MRSIIFLIFYITTHFACSSLLAAEEVKFDKISSNEIYEIRKYSDRLAIETAISNQGSSFRKLFNYISGNNENNEEIKMTTSASKREKKGNRTMQFYLPARFKKDNTLSPTNSHVQISYIEGAYYAVITYSGRASNKNFIKHKSILENELKKDDISILSPPIKATYNGPFTLPLFRRNEAMFEVNSKNKGEI